MFETQRLNEGLDQLWGRDEVTDCESARYRAMSDLVGEPI